MIPTTTKSCPLILRKEEHVVISRKLGSSPRTTCKSYYLSTIPLLVKWIAKITPKCLKYMSCICSNIRQTWHCFHLKWKKGNTQLSLIFCRCTLAPYCYVVSNALKVVEKHISGVALNVRFVRWTLAICGIITTFNYQLYNTANYFLSFIFSGNNSREYFKMLFLVFTWLL